VFDNQSVGLIVREAIRSALRPVRNHLKALMQMELMGRRQSTGASERALTLKYGRSRKYRGRFYGMVGMDKSHIEIHSFEKPEGATTKRKRGKQRGSGLFAMQAKAKKRSGSRSRVMTSSKQVFSRYKGNRRERNYIKGMTFKRRPSKYFHLIERGFNHRYGVRAIAYLFLQRTEQAMMAEAQQIFVTKLQQLYTPTIVKEINRRLGNVVK
jgi:hypothetical protein